MQLAQVIPRDVFHDAPSGLRLLSRVVDCADADDVIAQCAEAEAPRAADVYRQRPAERRPVGVRHVHRQPLLFARQQVPQRRQCDSCTDGHSHVARGVVDDVGQGRKVYADTGSSRRHAEVQHRAAAERIYGRAVGRGAADDLANLRARCRADDGHGAKVVNATGRQFHDT